MKKAQIQFMETIFVLLILIVIIFIGIIVIYSFYTKSLNEKRESIQDIDAVTLTSSIINMPEFTCGNQENCIDAMKILAFKSKLKNKQYYKTLFRNMDITIDIVYPAPEATYVDIECEEPLGTFNQDVYPTNCGKFILYDLGTNTQNKEIIQSPIQIYFPSINKRALGVLNIIVYK